MQHRVPHFKKQNDGAVVGRDTRCNFIERDEARDVESCVAVLSQIGKCCDSQFAD